MIAKEGLKDVDEAVSVRECIKYCKGSQTRKQRFLSLANFVILFIIKGYVKMPQQDGILLILCLKVPFITKTSLVIWRLLIVISLIAQEWMNGPKLKQFVDFKKFSMKSLVLSRGLSILLLISIFPMW